MQKKIIPILLISLIFLFSSVSAASHAFAITAPGAAGATTSSTYSMTWTPAYGGSYATDPAWNMDRNSISCYLDQGNTVYNKSIKIKTGMASGDVNAYTFDVQSYINSAARRLSPNYYVWCMNDSNSDQNAYSSGTLTITTFKAGDLGNMAIDFPGGLMAALGKNGYVMGVIVAIMVIITIAIDLLTGAFGIIDKVKDLAGRR